MDLSGESEILAPRANVWAALNDPDVLSRCIEGVETLERVGDDRFEGKLNAKVGPVRATFTGGVTLTEIDAPNRYVLVGEGKGGIAGFAKGSAEIRLTEGAQADRTTLHYHVTSSVGGKLAQLGARLIEGTAKAYADTFFTNFKAIVEDRGVQDAVSTVTGETVPEVAPSEGRTGDPPARVQINSLLWAFILIAVLACVLVWQLK